MKKVMFVFALALGAIMSSFTTRNTVDELVWFDDESGNSFVDFKTLDYMVNTLGYSTSGQPVEKVLIGYEAAREDEAFEVLSRDGDIITDAQIKTDEGFPTPDENLYEQ